jgi:hypothetical protein
MSSVEFLESAPKFKTMETSASGLEGDLDPILPNTIYTYL